MSLENMKFIVKTIVPSGTCTYWRGLGEKGDTTSMLTEATIFSWEDLTSEDKDTLKVHRKFTRIIPVGGLNAAHQH